jgi:hypothetical protein
VPVDQGRLLAPESRGIFDRPTMHFRVVHPDASTGRPARSRRRPSRRRVQAPAYSTEERRIPQEARRIPVMERRIPGSRQLRRSQPAAPLALA